MKQDVDRDEQVLALRTRGRSFVKIAAELGFSGGREAVIAYRRAIEQQPAKEQAAIRATERRRFAAMRESVRSNASLTPEDVATRLARIDRLDALIA